MTKKTRTILFWFFFLLFLLISPTIILYSQGYRLDFENRKITKTGGLFLKVFPKKAEIYLNDRLSKKTDFIFGSALIQNLLPKKYKIRIEKDGYFPWEKSLEIKEGQVTEAKEVILFPKNLRLGILFGKIKNFWISEDGRKIFLQEDKENGWSLSFYDLEKKTKNYLVDEREIDEKGANLINLEFSEDKKEINLEIEIEKKPKKFSLSIDKPILKEKEVEKIPEAIAVSKTEKDFYYLDRFGFVIKTDQFFRGGLKLNRNPFPVKKEVEYKLEIFGNWLFLREGNHLYFLDFEDSSFKELFDEISALKISPDGKKLALFSRSEIWLIFLEERTDQPRKMAKEKVFLTRLSEKIGDLFWLNSSYLIFNSGNKIKAIEIDARDRINIYDLTEKKEPKIFWDGFDKKLYILSEGNLFFSEEFLL